MTPDVRTRTVSHLFPAGARVAYCGHVADGDEPSHSNPCHVCLDLIPKPPAPKPRHTHVRCVECGLKMCGGGPGVRAPGRAITCPTCPTVDRCQHCGAPWNRLAAFRYRAMTPLDSRNGMC